MNSTLLILSNSKPGREADYVKWYSDQHLGDVCRTPGIVGGGFYEIDGDAAPQWRHAGLYEVEGPFSGVLEGFGKRGGTSEMPMTDSIDLESVLMLGATPRGPRKAGAKSSGPVAIFPVLTNAPEGREAQFQDWYDNQHIGDVLAMPGVVGAQRFDVASELAGKASPWAFLALYELDANRLDEVRKEIGARAGGPKMPIMEGLGMPYQGMFKKVA